MSNRGGNKGKNYQKKKIGHGQKDRSKTNQELSDRQIKVRSFFLWIIVCFVSYVS